MLPYVLVFLGISLAGFMIYLGCARIAREISRLASEISSLQPRVNVSVSGENNTQPQSSDKVFTSLPDSVISEIASIKSEGFGMDSSTFGEAAETILDEDFSGLSEGLRRAR